MSALLETLAAELERPRELSARVLNYITGSYDVDGSEMGLFLVEKLPGLEDYEIDLILSPVFTPKLADQAVFAELLGRNSVPREQWPDLIRKLAARPTSGQLVTPDKRSHSVPLREVTIERYVHRLRLDGAISESLLELTADRPVLKAIARSAIWENDGRRNILVRYLTNTPADDSQRLTDALELLDFVEIHKPADVADLLARIPPRQEALRGQINALGKPFFSSRVQELHGGEHDQRRKNEGGTSAKENEFAFLERLKLRLH